MWIEYFLVAFTDHYPIFMMLITLAGVVAVGQIIRIAVDQAKKEKRNVILSAGLTSLFVGLLVFPIETFTMLHVIKAAGDSVPSIVLGGFYTSFIPLFYGLFWFLISFAGWLFYKSKTSSVFAV
jgi:hypothetical protein